jgi:hypothetical protein
MACIERTLIHSQTLPVALTNGNDGRGRAWYASANNRKKLASMLFPFRRKPFGHPVGIRITRILGKREQLWDADSVGRGNAKELVDTLTELGWWSDDGPPFITYCDYRQDKSQRENGPCVKIEVFDDSPF